MALDLLAPRAMFDRIATVAHKICPFCDACCGLKLTLDEGRITRTRGHAEDAHSAGFRCPKGAALRDRHGDRDRLRAPLIKRDGEHVEVSWDEAFAEIERRLAVPRVVRSCACWGACIDPGFRGAA
jgi:anaerobic selenocysteine-containing dehydrogenase